MAPRETTRTRPGGRHVTLGSVSNAFGIFIAASFRGSALVTDHADFSSDSA